MGTAALRRVPGFELTLVCAGVFLSSLDQTSVVTALPEVMIDLGIPIDELGDVAWLVTAYLLGFTVAMPLLGRIGDVHGHARLFRGALLLFAAGSVITAAGGSLSVVLAGRVVQAIGGGALIPAALAIGSRRSPWRHPAIALGVVGAAAELGAVLGPLYGGGIIHWLGWRWIFWSNLPVVALLLVGSSVIGQEARARRPLDLAGGLALAAALSLLAIGLAQRGTYSGGLDWPAAVLGAGLVMVALLIVIERRAIAPLLDPGLFFARRFLAAWSAQLLVGAALIMALVTVPLMTDTVLGKPPVEGGLRLMRLTGAIPVGALLGAFATRRVGARVPTIGGLLLAALGLWLMSGWDEAIADPEMSLHLALAGLGFGLVIAPLLTVAVVQGGDEDRGTASALITVARMLGMTLGLAALAAWGMGHFQVLTAEFAFPLPLPGEAQAAFAARQAAYSTAIEGASVSVFTAFFRVGAVLSLVAIVPAALLDGRSASRPA